MHIDFRDPPRARAYVTIDHAELIDKLKARPGEWALIPRTYANANTARSMAHYIRSGMAKYAPKGAFEAVSRTKDGDAHVWVRYLGAQADRAA